MLAQALASRDPVPLPHPSAAPCRCRRQEPLLLYACAFEGLAFRRTERAAQFSAGALCLALERHLVAAAMTSSILARLHADEKARRWAVGSRARGGAGEC